MDCASNHKELKKFITKMLKSLKVEFELKLIEVMPIKEKYKLYEKLKLAKKINK